MIRLAICIPVYGDTKAKFTLSLANSLIHFLDCKLADSEGNPIDREVEVFMVSCSMLTEGRHRLVAEALAWDATHLLWMDADHVFPADAIPRLLSRNVDIVGANYARRHIPTSPTAVGKGQAEGEDSPAKLVYTGPDDKGMEEVDHIGFGLCLINMTVFDRLQMWADEHDDGNFLPLFQFTPTEDKIGMIGEDVFFFRKCREAGAKVFVDHALSWEVGHIFEQILTNAHCVSHKDRWEEWRRTKYASKVREAAEATQ